MDALQGAVRKGLLGRALTELFGEAAAGSIREIEAGLDTVHLAGGERLFSQGDPGDCMYIVMGDASGRSPGRTERRNVR